MKFLLAFIVCFFFATAIAGEIKTQLSFFPESTEYHEGDVVDIDLKVWPIENADTEEFKKLEGSTLFNSLEITQVSSVEVSENNADVVLIEASAVVTKAPASQQEMIQYKNENIAVVAPKFKFIPLATKHEDFYVLDQSIVSSHTLLRLFVLLFVVGLLAVGFYYFRFKEKNKKSDQADLTKNYKNLFSKAETRKDFEQIYAAKKEWVPLLKAETSAHREFFKTMELHQYKKDWGKVEVEEVKNSFEIIRGSFV